MHKVEGVGQNRQTHSMDTTYSSHDHATSQSPPPERSVLVTVRYHVSDNAKVLHQQRRRRELRRKAYVRVNANNCFELHARKFY